MCHDLTKDAESYYMNRNKPNNSGNRIQVKEIEIIWIIWDLKAADISGKKREILKDKVNELAMKSAT
jgi:hypothetical protein